jgi:hypothetical protein
LLGGGFLIYHSMILHAEFKLSYEETNGIRCMGSQCLVYWLNMFRIISIVYYRC